MSAPTSSVGNSGQVAAPSLSSPGNTSSTPVAAPPAKSQSTVAKPRAVNVFSNDGSFLERLQRSKKEEEERKKQDEMLARKRAFDDRFKRRGKRRNESLDDEPTDSADSVAPPAKKSKELTKYEKEVKGYEGISLKDNGIGVRPLVK